jgi:hypothetical protein
MDKLQELKNKINEIQAKSAVAPEMKAFVTLVLTVVKDAKDNFANISKENQQLIQESIAYLESFHEKQVNIQDNKLNLATSKIEAKIDQLKALSKELNSKIEEVKAIEVKDGKDADEEKIVEDVLSKIKLPEYEVYTLEDKGEDIVKEINALPTDEDEYKIDFTHLKNVPDLSSNSFGGPRTLYTLADVNIQSPTNAQVLKYNSTTQLWENNTDSGVTGSGTTNYLSKWTSANVLGNSLIYDNGTNVGIGTTSLSDMLTVGSITNGGSASIYATEGSELAPALEAVYWTLGTNWTAGSGQLAKAAGGGTTAYPTTPISVTADRTYKVVVTVSAITTAQYIAFTLGGIGNQSNLAVGTNTYYIRTKDTSNLIFYSAGATETVTITGLSVKLLTETTGNLNVYNNLSIKGSTTFNNGVRFGGSDTLGIPNVIRSTSSDGINFSALRIERKDNSSLYLDIYHNGASVEMKNVGDKPLNIINTSTNNGINFLVNTSTKGITIANTGNVLLGTYVDSGYKLDVQGTGRFTDTLNLIASSSTVKPLIVKAAASQTANLTEWQNSSGTVLTTINNNGYLGIGNTSPSQGLEVGSTTTGLNAKTTSTLGSEMSPGFSSGWTFDTAAWSLSGGTLVKTATGAGNATPTGTFTVTAGRTYLISFTYTGCNSTFNAYGSYSLGGVSGKQMPVGSGTITDYIVAKDTSKIIFSDGSGAGTITITSLSVKELTPSTGDLTVDGSIIANGSVNFRSAVSFGVSAPAVPQAPLSIMTSSIGASTDALRIYRPYSTTQYVSIVDQGGWKAIISTGDKEFQFVQYASGTVLPWRWYINTSTNVMNISNSGNLLVNTSTDSGYKLDVNGTGRFTGSVDLGTSALLKLYNTADQTTNYERLEIGWASNIANIFPSRGGTGTRRSLRIGASAGGSTIDKYLQFNATGAPAASWVLGAGNSAGSMLTINTGGGALSSTDNKLIDLSEIINQSGTSSYAILYGDITETSVGTGTKDFIKFKTGGVDKFNVSSAGAMTLASTLLNQVLVSPKSTTPVTVANADSNTYYTNEGATALGVFNLPTAVANLKYTFIVQDSDGIKVVANTGDTIRVGGVVSGTAGYTTSTNIGDVVTLVAINATEWVATSIVGSWTTV